MYFFRLFNLLQSKTYVLMGPMASSAYRYYKKFKDHATHFDLELAVAELLMKEHDYSNADVLNSLLKEIQTLLQGYLKSLKGANNF